MMTKEEIIAERLAVAHEPVDCPHLHRGVCIEASRLLGLQIITTPPVCNITCPKHGGPFAGAEISDEQRGRWAGAMLKYAWGPTAQKVWERYGKPFDVWVPPILPRVQEAFAGVRANPNVIGLGLTGSILSKRTDPPKDLDVLLVVRDWREWLDNPTPTPAEVDGIRVDLFVSDSFETYFAVLDVDTLKLYTTSAYNIRSIDPTITRVDVMNPIYEGFRAAAHMPQQTPQDARRRAAARGGCGGCGRAKRGQGRR